MAVARSALPVSECSKNAHSAAMQTSVVPTTHRLCALICSTPSGNFASEIALLRSPSPPKIASARPDRA